MRAKTEATLQSNDIQFVKRLLHDVLNNSSTIGYHNAPVSVRLPRKKRGEKPEDVSL